MSRKHFEAIAKAMCLAIPLDPVMWQQWKRDVHSLAAALATFNPNFDHARFYRACGLVEEVRRVA